MSWTPPTDDPARVNAQSYAVKLMPYIAKVAPSFDPGSQDAYGWYSYWPLTLFAAGWKITDDAAYARRASLAMSRVRSALAKETHAPESEVKLINKYWHGGEVSAMLTAIRAFETRPEHAQLLRELGNAFVDHFEALPLYWETGAGNREWQAAFLYDMALTYGRPTSRRAEFKKYADEIWNFWFPFRDSDEDSENYSLLDLAILLEWPALRGLHWESDSKLIDLWRHYAGLITNDGTYVSYGDAGTNGDYMFAVRVAEVAARASKSGQYKWLAHRAFWNGRDRLDLLEKNWYEQQRLHLALAYLVADETVKEVPVGRSTIVTYRQFRELADFSKNAGCGPTSRPCKPHLYLHPDKQPSKVVFRAGARERDATLVLQAGNRAGHGHPDAGAVIHYSGNSSIYLCNGVSREDYDLEQHNLVVLQDPARANPWQEHRLTSERTSVPVAAQLEDSGYARLRIGPYPGVTPDQIAASWPKILATNAKDDFRYLHAIGYKNWPVVMDRAVLFVGGMGAVVRDIIFFQLAVQARVGQNWIIGDIVARDSAGSWVIHHVPTMSNYQYVDSKIKAPIETGPENLLIWMDTSGGAPIQMLPLRPPEDLTYHQNLTHRVWRPVTSNWAAGSHQMMTTALIPLNPANVTPGSIPVIAVDSPSGNLSVRMRTGLSYRVFLGSPSGQFTFDEATFTGEAAVVVAKTGQPARLYGWQLTHLVVGSNVLWAGPKPTNGIWVLH